MSALEDLTVLIITWNEEANIGRTLDSLHWARRILIIDSGSTDATVQILEQHDNVKVVQRPFSSFADQCNFGLEQVQTSWVLSIDADYVFLAESAAAIERAIGEGAAAWQAEFDYCIEGEPVRGSILPPRTVLYRKNGARYRDDGHGHRVVVEGATRLLPFRIRHDDRKPLSRWLHSQVTYARQEADKLLDTPASKLSRNDRIRKTIVLAPPLVFILVYVLRGGFLSGWRGLFYALQRFTAELLLSLFLVDAKLKSVTRAGKEN